MVKICRIFKELYRHLQDKERLSKAPTATRWGMLSIFSTVGLSLVAIGIAIWSWAFAIFGICGGDKMTGFVIVVTIIVVLVGCAAIFMGLWILVKAAGLVDTWREEPYKTSIDVITNNAINRAKEIFPDECDGEKKNEIVGQIVGELLIKAKKMTDEQED
jgi:hypothetical protein